VPRSHALAVRVVASQDRRALRVQDLEHIATLEQARKRLEHVDAEREAFIRKFFGVHVDAAAAYDMILNTDRFDTQQAAQAIAETFKQRFAEDMQPMIRSGWASDEDMSSVAT
jgi:cytidylate kinase